MSDRTKSANCPYCETPMRPVAMRCDVCESEVRASFRENPFVRLAEEDVAFLEKYLLVDFSIKALAERTGLGYTAIRGRLDRLIENYRALRDREVEKRKILDKLSSGEITAAEATRLIAQLI